MSRVIIKSLPNMNQARDRVTNARVILDNTVYSDKLKEFAKNKSYYIHTYGCQANVRDEEIMAGYLEKCGFCKTFDKDKADIAIINTCAVRENAEDKIYGEIGTFKQNIKRNKDFILCICGCMMQQEGIAEYLVKTYPQISIIFGTHNISSLVSLLEEHIITKKVIIDVKSCAGDIIENLPSSRLDSYKASVNISYGCNKFCTYCIVPYTRGKERSRPAEEIICECKSLVERGYQEITLLGQNVNSYGKDLKDGTTFAMILEEVAKLGIPRLRFLTSHPWDFSEDMLRVIAKYKNIMNCIHLPLQSGSDKILNKMGRRYNTQEYLSLVKKIRTIIPDVAITTDIIVGFPNESDEDFEGTIKMCKEVEYSAAYTFIYSPRKGTPAAVMQDSISDEIKHIRFNRLVKTCEDIITKNSEHMVGKVYKVLVDGPSKKDPTVLAGYTETSKMVNFKGPNYLKGEIVEVKILENHTFFLMGELIEDPILIKANSFKNALMKEPLIQEYISLKHTISKDKFLIQLRAHIKELENEYKVSKEKVILNKLQDAEQEYANNPLVSNLNYIGEQVNSLLLPIAEELK